MLAANSEIEISNSDCLTALFALSVDKWNMNDRERRQTVFCLVLLKPRSLCQSTVLVILLLAV